MISFEKYKDDKRWGWYRMVPEEWRRWVATPHPTRVLEIGAFDGVSANVMLDAIFPHQESTVDTIDPFFPDPTTRLVNKGIRALFEENCRRGGHGDRVKLHVGSSLEVLSRMLAEGMRESFDMVFVDGSHLAADVMTDAALAWPLLKPGGTLVFDDFQWGNDRPPHRRPREAILAFEAAFVEKLVPLWTGYQRIYRKAGVPGGLWNGDGEVAQLTCAIVGTYDSGSSVLSSIMECLGFSICRPAWYDFSESASLRKILVESIDQESQQPKVESGALVVRLRNWLSEVREPGQSICVKHPMLGLCLPELAEAWGGEVVLIRALRPLDASIRGLKRREWFPEPERIQQVLAAKIDHYFSTGRSCIAVDYGELLKNPQATVRRVVNELGIRSEEAVIKRAASLVGAPEANAASRTPETG